MRRLNERAGTAFKPTGRKTRELIRARFAEGFDEADFETVIDAMCDEWGGDPEMAGYLRPETLFGTKFEGYLNRPAARSAAARRPRGDPDAAWRPADPVDTPESLAEAEAAFEAKWGEKPC